MADPLDDLISKYETGGKKPSADPLDELISRHSAGQTAPGSIEYFDGGKPKANQPRILPVDAEPRTPEERQFAEQLRNKADRDLLASRELGQGYAAVSSFGNTLGLNAPRNIVAALHSFQTGKPFDEEYKYIKAIDEAAARQYPITTGAAAVTGALAQAPILPGAAAETVLGRAAQSAAAGGLLSGASEFMDSKDEQKANEAFMGGALLGGVASPVVEGVAKGAGAALRAPANMVRGFINPDDEAGRRVMSAFAADKRVGGLRMKPGEFEQYSQAGVPVVVADVGGEATRALVRSAANTSPEARQALQRVTSDRFDGQAPRISEYVMGMGSGNGALDTKEALQAAAKRANKPAYDKAYAEGANGVWNDSLAGLSTAPDVADAIRRATRTGENKAAADGFKPVKNPFVVGEDGTVSLAKNKDGSTAYPSLQFWDAVKQNLDDTIERYARAGEKGAANDARNLKNQLLAQLDEAAPSYKSARAGAAKAFGAQDALEAGEIFASPKARGKNSEYAREIAKMSPPEKALFAEGFLSKLSEQIRETGDRRNVLNTIFNSPAAKERVAMAIGPGRARNLEAYLHVERIMDELRTNVSGNSTTARQLAEAGLAGGVAGGFLGGNDPTDISLGALMGAAARTGKMKIDARVAQRVGEMLASKNPNVLKKAVDMAAKNNRLLDFLKEFEVKAVSTGAGTASERYQDR